MADLGMCDKRQYEHNGPHEKIGERGQNFPPFPCVNWHPVVVDRPVQEAARDDPNDISKDVRNGFVCGAWKKSLEASGIYVMRCDRPEGHAGYHVDKVLLTNWNGPTPAEAQKAREAAGDGFEEWNSRTPIRSGERWLIDYTVQERRTAWTACAERMKR